MASTADIKVLRGQGDAIKRVHDVKRQTFKKKRFPGVPDRKGKKETGEEKFASPDKGRIRDDGTKGGRGSEEQYSDSGNKSKKKKDSKVRGGLVDLVI